MCRDIMCCSERARNEAQQSSIRCLLSKYVYLNMFLSTGRGEPFSRQDFGEFSPYDEKGDLIGLLTTGEFVDKKGSGDRWVQSYNFRLCTTQNQTMVPFPKPARYNRSDWALLIKYATDCPAEAVKRGQGGLGGDNMGKVPGGKFDMNNGGLISTDCVGCAWSYPNSSYADRKRIHQLHKEYQQGYLWTLAHDAAIPEAVRAELNKFGLCKDEFVENDHWPEQLYVRESLRMVGDAVFTQNDVLAMRQYSEANESAGMGSYPFDSHYVHRGPCLPIADRTTCRMLTRDDPPLTLACTNCAATSCVVLERKRARRSPPVEHSLPPLPQCQQAQKRNNSYVWTGGEGYGGVLKQTAYELPFSALLPQKACSHLSCASTPISCASSTAVNRFQIWSAFTGRSRQPTCSPH